MKIIDHQSIAELNVSPDECVQWVREAFLLKNEAKLPPKVSIKMEENVFFNTMPCYIPAIERIGIKVVSRFPKREPSLQSDLLLYDSASGNSLALMNADWITAMRTGAVAALSVNELKSSFAAVYAFVGLGNTARATLLCLLASNPEVHHHVRILTYKDHTQGFMERFDTFRNVTFEVVQTREALVENADVIVSCVTALDELFVNDECYKEGVLVLPVHTRGFQNCDLFFDKVFGDDTGHVKDFKYFDKFKSFSEFSDVLGKTSVGRSNDHERIIAYNIGIALHDVYFAHKLHMKLNPEVLNEIDISTPSSLGKFWI